MKAKIDRTLPKLDEPLSGSALIKRMALLALNRVNRERHEARRLFKQWLMEDEALVEAVSGRAIDQAIAIGIREDIQQERDDVLRMARAHPIIEVGVPVGAPVLTPRSACIPVASAEADARRAARIVQYSDYWGWPMPETGKPFGDSKPWEAKNGSIYYGKGRKGMEQREVWLALVWQACPDRDLPESKQRTIKEQLDTDTIRRLDQRAERLVALRTLELGGDA